MSQIQSARTAMPPLPLEGAVIYRVAVVDQITRDQRSRFHSVSLPGHLLHVVTRGRVEQTVSGVQQEIGPGDAIWYYENDEVQGRVLETPWTFYTVNFFAPTLSPPPFPHRVQRVGQSLIDRMQALLDTWRSTSLRPTVRHLKVHALLLDVLLELLPESVRSFRLDSPTLLWWELEAKIRADLSHPIDIRLLERLCGRSERTIIRACRAAVGQSPMRRIKELRLSYARGLVQLSNMSMTEIAYRIGYGRVQEFSRDYGTHFGVVPSRDRSRGPQYREWDSPADTACDRGAGRLS